MLKRILLLPILTLSLTACEVPEESDGAQERYPSIGLKAQSLLNVCAMYIINNQHMGDETYIAKAYNLYEQGWTDLENGVYVIHTQNNDPNDLTMTHMPITERFPHNDYICAFIHSNGEIYADVDPTSNMRGAWGDIYGTRLEPGMEHQDQDYNCDRVVHEEYCGEPTPLAIERSIDVLFE